MSAVAPAGGDYPPLANILFDLDGTLIDSSPLHDQAFRATLAARAPRLVGDFDYQRHKGRPTGEVFAQLGVEDAGKRGEMIALKQARYRAAVAAGELDLFPGARDLLTTLGEAGLGLYLVTGASAGSAGAALRAGGLAGLLVGLITADDVARGKPAPDGYLECLARFGLDPKACLAVEDASDGIAAARGAGLRVWGVHDPAIGPLCDGWAPDLPSLGVELRGLAQSGAAP